MKFVNLVTLFVFFLLYGDSTSSTAKCDLGWKINENDHCFRFFPAALTWQDALNSCVNQNAMLAVIDSNTTNDFITKNITQGLRSWIGLHDRFTPDTWTWVIEGSIASYVNWAPGEPNNFMGLINAEECAEIEDAGGQWNDEPCDSIRPYVCQKSLGCSPRSVDPVNYPDNTLISIGNQLNVNVTCLPGYRPVNATALTTCRADGRWSRDNFRCKEIFCDSPLPMPVGLQQYIDALPGSYLFIGTKIYYSCNVGYRILGNEEATCRDISPELNHGVWDQPPICLKSPECEIGWTAKNMYCYKFFDELQNWENAELKCVEKKARLVSIQDRFENALVYSLSNGNAVWIGLHDKPKENTWEWTDGNSVKYKNFAAGEPNNGQFFNFWETEDCVEMMYLSEEWNDEECSNELEFVCKKTLF